MFIRGVEAFELQKNRHVDQKVFMLGSNFIPNIPPIYPIIALSILFSIFLYNPYKTPYKPRCPCFCFLWIHLEELGQEGINTKLKHRV